MRDPVNDAAIDFANNIVTLNSSISPSIRAEIAHWDRSVPLLFISCNRHFDYRAGCLKIS